MPAGLALIVGATPLTATLDASLDGFQATVFGDLFRLRLPRALFVPVIERGGELVADPDPEHFVEIALPVALAIDQDSNLDFIWPEEEAGAFALPSCMLGTSGVIISANSIFLRLSDNQPLPDDADTAGIPARWRGVYIREAAVHLPKGMLGKVDLTSFSLKLGVAPTAAAT